MEEEVRATFRKVFPEYSAQLDAAVQQAAGDPTKSDELLAAAGKNMLADARNKLQELLAAAKLPLKTEQSVAFGLTPGLYRSLVDARGDNVKHVLVKLIQGLQELKTLEKGPKEKFATAMLGVGVPFVAPATPAFYEALIGGATEVEAAGAGVVAVSPAVVIAILIVLVIAIIFILFLIETPANCVALLINELDQPLTFDGEANVHGKPQTVTNTIPPILVAGNARYPMAGFFASERDTLTNGTQYGFSMVYRPVGHLSFGVCCTLTPLGGPNSCWCGFGASAITAAYRTDEFRRPFFEDRQHGVYLSIRCNSGSGWPSYYIARACPA